MSGSRDLCSVTGKEIWLDKDAARAAARSLARVRNGRGKALRCDFGDHYHISKGLRGRKGKGDFR